MLSCSKSEIEDTLIDNSLVNTTWTHRVIGNISGDVYKYEVVEFKSNEDFTISEFDLNEIRTNYLAKGKYIINGDKILCSYTIQNNNKELILILNDKNNTIGRVNQQVRIYKNLLKNSFLGELNSNFSLGLLFNLC